MTYKTMRGAEEEIRSNPPVRSKFDKSHGHGLKAPHLSFPGQTCPTTSAAPRVYEKPGNMKGEVADKMGDSSTTIPYREMI